MCKLISENNNSTDEKNNNSWFWISRSSCIQYDSNIFEDFSDFVIVINEEYDLNLHETNCQWMIIDDLNIQIH
jgi:hypothetical protein